MTHNSNTHWLHRILLRPLLARLLLVLLTLNTTAAFALEQVKLGILDESGPEMALKKWSATADYLNEIFTNYNFTIKPLDFDEVENAVATNSVDFILTHPGLYILLEHDYEVSRIATLKKRIEGKIVTTVDSVVFMRADNSKINSYEDLKGSSLMAVTQNSFGGFQMAWREMLDHSVDPFTDLSELQFAGTHDAVVYRVLNGEADAGTVKSGILERMASEGKIDLSMIKAIMQEGDGQHHGLHHLHSTRSYPGWPFAKLSKTDLQLAEQVAITLINMPENSDAALSAESNGWTIPLSYSKVHELFRELELPPYAKKSISLGQFVTQNKLIAILVLGAIVATLLLVFYISHINSRLKKLGGELQLEVDERTYDLKQREQELEVIIDTIPSMVFVKDAKDLRFVRFNRTGEKLLGKSRDTLIGQTAHDLYPADQADRINERDREVLESHQVLDIEEEPIDTPQGIRYMHTRKVGIYDDDDTPLYLIGISNDVTENRMVRKQLDHFATYDALTGLYNRRVLENRLADEFNRYKRYKEPFTVFMLDIDHFKQCNDTYGHIAGDNVLRALAETIESTIRNTDFAARYGGEEFTVVLPETSLEDSEILANRLLTQTFRIRVPTEDKGDIRIRISIGVASTTSTTKEWKEVLKEADQALYAAKQAGRNCVKMSVNGNIL